MHISRILPLIAAALVAATSGCSSIPNEQEVAWSIIQANGQSNSRGYTGERESEAEVLASLGAVAALETTSSEQTSVSGQGNNQGFSGQLILPPVRTNSNISIGGFSGSSCEPFPQACKSAQDRAAVAADRFFSQGEAGSRTTLSASFCVTQEGYKASKACAAAFRSSGNTKCANQHDAQATSYRKAMNQYRAADIKLLSSGTKVQGC